MLQTTNTDIHQYWSWKFRQKERNKPSVELMAKLKADYPDIENWTSQQCQQAMLDYQALQASGQVPPAVLRVGKY